MKKWLMSILMMAMSCQMFAGEKYGVIICGDLAGDAEGNPTGYGGMSYFWNDTYMVWEMLIKQGFDNDNIFVFYGDDSDTNVGTDGIDWEYSTDRYNIMSDENASLRQQVGNITDITDLPATKQEIEYFITQLLPSMVSSDDFLFVATISHGAWGTTEDPIAAHTTPELENQESYPSYFVVRPPTTGYYLIDGYGPFDIIQDFTFAGWFENVAVNKTVYWMEQCHGGGFKNELSDSKDNVFFISASRWNEMAFGVDKINNENALCYFSNGSVAIGRFDPAVQTWDMYKKGEHGEIFFNLLTSTMGERIVDRAEYLYSDFVISGTSTYYDAYFSSVDGYDNSSFITPLFTKVPLNSVGYKSIQDGIVSVEESKLWSFDYYVPMLASPTSCEPSTYPTQVSHPDYADAESIGYHTSLKYPTLIFNNTTLSYDAASPAYNVNYASSLKGIMAVSADLDITADLTLPSGSHTTVLAGRTVNIEAGKNLILESGAQIVLESGAHIIINDGATLYLKENTMIDLTEVVSTIEVKEGGSIIGIGAQNISISTPIVNNNLECVLTWDTVSDATDYHICRSNLPDAGYIEIGQTATTTYTDQSGFTDGVYFYRVLAGKVFDQDAVIFDDLLSVTSETLGFSKTECIDYENSDYHNIALLFDEDFEYSDEIDPNGTKFHSISGYDNVEKAWLTSSFENNVWTGDIFPVSHGMPLRINNLVTNFDFITKGEYAVTPSYSIISGDNFITLPVEENEITTTLELATDIDNLISNPIPDPYKCRAVYMWDSDGQHWDGSTRTIFGTWSNNFSINVGTPLYIYCTDNVTWPSVSKGTVPTGSQVISEIPEITIPRALYFRIVNCENSDYDFSDVDKKTIFTQPKDDFISFKAWISGREEDILTDDNFGCGFSKIGNKYSSIYINLGNFEQGWKSGDVINFEVTDTKNSLLGKGESVINEKFDAIFRGFDGYIEGTGDPIVLDTPTSIEEMVPTTTALHQNYPNPFNPVTQIKYDIAETSNVKLNIYNTNGQLVANLVDGKVNPGFHTANFDANKLNSGVYIYTLQVGDKAFSKKMVLVK